VHSTMTSRRAMQAAIQPTAVVSCEAADAICSIKG